MPHRNGVKVGRQAEVAFTPSARRSSHKSEDSLRLDIEGLDLGGALAEPEESEAVIEQVCSPKLRPSGKIQQVGSKRPGKPAKVPFLRPDYDTPDVVELPRVRSTSGVNGQAAAGSGKTISEDSFTAHLTRGCVREDDMPDLDASAARETEAPSDAANSRPPNEGQQLLGAFASLGSWPSVESAENRLRQTSSSQFSTFSTDRIDSIWGGMSRVASDAGPTLDLLSVEEMGLHSIDMGTPEDWEGCTLSVSADQAETSWCVARSTRQQRKWIVAPRMATEADAGPRRPDEAQRTVIVSEYGGLSLAGPSSTSDASPFAGHSQFELRFLCSATLAYQLATPSAHRRSRRHQVRKGHELNALPGGCNAAGGSTVAATQATAGRREARTVQKTDAEHHTPPEAPFGAPRAPPNSFGAYSLAQSRLPPGWAQVEKRPAPASPRGSAANDVPLPLLPDDVLESLQAPSGFGLRNNAATRLGRPRHRLNEGKGSRRFSDWFRRKPIAPGLGADAMIDPDALGSASRGVHQHFVPLTRSHSRPYRKSPGPASRLILAPSEREKKLRAQDDATPSLASPNLEAVAQHSVPPKLSFFATPRAGRRRSWSDDQILVGRSLDRKRNELRAQGRPASRMEEETSAPSSRGSSPAPSLRHLADRATGATGHVDALDLLGMDIVPSHALTMLLPLPLLGGDGSRAPARRYVRLSFVPFCVLAPGSVGIETEDTQAVDGAPDTHAQPWFRRFASAFGASADAKPDEGGRGTEIGNPAGASALPSSCVRRRTSAVEAFRVTAQVLGAPSSDDGGSATSNLDQPARERAQTPDTEERGLPEPSSFPVVIATCSSLRRLDLIAEGWAALGLLPGPALAAPQPSALTGLADIVIAGCAAVMDV